MTSSSCATKWTKPSVPAPRPADALEVHGHLLGAEAAWREGRHFDAVLNVRCAADVACDYGDEERSVELYQAAAELSSSLPAPPSSHVRTRRSSAEVKLGVRVAALAKLPIEVRVRVAVDVLGDLLARGIERNLPRSPSSRLRFDNVRIDSEGRAYLRARSTRSGAGTLLWEILAGRPAPSNAPPPLAAVVPDVPYAIDVLAAQAQRGDPECERIDQILRYLHAVAGSYIASRDDVRGACGIGQFDEPTQPGTPSVSWDDDDEQPPSGVRQAAQPTPLRRELDRPHDPEMGPTQETDMLPILEAAGFLEQEESEPQQEESEPPRPLAPTVVMEPRRGVMDRAGLCLMGFGAVLALGFAVAWIGQLF